MITGRYFTGILFYTALLFATSLQAKTASGVITGDTTWSGIITVTGDVMVSSGTLTIEPGTVIRFAETNDNPVFGTLNRIRLLALLQGGIKAIGTPWERITFTSDAAVPVPGAWDKVQVVANGSRSEFAYCDFLYGRDGVDVSNPSGYTGTSDVAVRYCSFKYFSHQALYCFQGSQMTIDHCLVEDGLWGLFAERPSRVSVTNSYFIKTANAILASGFSGDTTNIHIDHVTIHDVSLSRDPSPKWWSGYGIFFTTDTGIGTVTNTIFDKCDVAGMRRNTWDLTYGYNCYGLMLTYDMEGDLLAASDINADPWFFDPGTNYAIYSGSPCDGTASDGKNRGAWQEGDEWPYGYATAVRNAALPTTPGTGKLDISPNPFTNRTGIRMPGLNGPVTIRIFDTAGNGVFSTDNVSAAKGFTWDGRDDTGNRLQPGTYLCVVKTATERLTARIILAY